MESRADETQSASESDVATPDASQGCDSNTHADLPSDSQQRTAEQHGTPMTRRVVTGGLGLHAPSVRTPENASMYSDRSGFDSVSGDSKPPSQKSSGMSLVRRLRRLSSAALHGKVNRLFSRSNNLSQDSLLISGPASPSPCPSPGAMPGSPTVCARSDSSDSFRGRKPPSYAMYERQTVGVSVLTSSPAAEWRANNAHNLPPLPPKPLSTRRNRAMTEVTPLAIRGQLGGAEGDAASLGANDSNDALQKIAQSRAKAANSPLVTSPLSRKSFHTLHAAAGLDESGGRLAACPPHMAKSASENQFSALLASSTLAPQRTPPMNSRTLSRDMASVEPPVSATADAHRPAVSQRLGYQHLGYFNDDTARRAADTPSPPDKTIGRSQAYYASDLGTPTIQRRRTALTALDWASQSGAMTLQPSRLSQDALPPPPLPPPKPQQQQQQQLRQPEFGIALTKGSSGSRADSPVSMLSAFQAHPRVISGRLHQPSANTSARSSTSIASESTPSWVSAMSNADGDAREGEDNEGDERMSGHGLPSFAIDQVNRSTNLGENMLGSAAPDSISMPVLATSYRPRWSIPSVVGPQARFDSSLLDWQMSQEESATTYSRSPSSISLAREPARAMAIAPLSTDAFGAHGRYSESAESSTSGHIPPFALERRRVISTPSRTSATSLAVSAEPPAHQPLSEADELDVPMAELALSSASGDAASATSSHSASTSLVSVSQLIRPRGGSQPIHLARAATTNAIRLKEKSAGQPSYGAIPSSQLNSDMRAGPGSAPESFNIDLAIEKNKARLRVRATSASSQSFVPGDNSPFGLDGLSPSYSSGSNASHSQHNTLSRGNAVAGMPTSRPTSSMSAYTMSPMSSTAGDDHQSVLMTQLWQPSAMFRSSPERTGDSHAASAGMYTPSSTSSPPTHYHIGSSQSQQHGNPSGSHSARLNPSSVQRSASGHSVSSGISELLEPSSVSQARKDALWQVLVVSKSRADSEIDKIMRQWKESDSGTIVCTLDVDAKPGVGDDDAMILMVKRGHRRSTSDIKRTDGDKNEFRRRVVDLTSVIRSSTVAELSNERFTRGITEQLYGLLTEQRTRFPADANIGTLILDVLYQFSAVSQTVSQLSMSTNVFPSGARGGASGEASPAISQFPSPLLAPDASLGRGMLGHIQPLSSALSAHYEIASARNASRGHQLATSSASVLSELGDYRIGRTASENLAHTTSHLQRHQQGSSSDSYLLGSAGTRSLRPLESGVTHVSSPRLVPGTAHSSTASLISLLAPVHASSSYSANGSIGRSGAIGGSVLGQAQPVAGLQQRQRSYFPQPSTPHSSRLSVDTPESEVDMPTRQSMDDAAMRPTLRRHVSKLSVSSEAADIHGHSYRSAARASLQPHQFYQYSARQNQHALSLQIAPPSTPQVPTLQSSFDRDGDSASATTPKHVARPASMCISSGGGYSSLRHFSESFSRQEKLANLLGQDSDFSDSVPTSPAEPPARPFLDIDSLKRNVSRMPLVDSLRTIPETRRGSEVDICGLERQLAHLSDTPASTDTQTLPKVGELAISASGDAAVDGTLLAAGDAAVAVAREADSAPADLEPSTAVAVPAEDELVICRMCERGFCRSELDAHSDVCVLEQTRAMQLDVVNQRIKRLRDSISKRLSDIKKMRQWDRVAIRESERIIRIANRSIAWPEGDSQHEQMVAKAKFTKYIDKLETITGKSAPNTAPAVADGTTSPAIAIASTGGLPRADIETIWLAVHLLARVQEKFTIIEEFDQEFSRLEQQEALVREAESLSYDIGSEPGSQFHELATWSQLAHAGRVSPVASERTSMDYMPSQSESGSATPDTHASYSAALGKSGTALTRRHSRHSRPDRRSLSRSAKPGAELVDADSQSNGSGSRKRVSLFAALFRNSSIANVFTRGKDSATNSSVLRRKNTPSSFASSSLQSIGKPSSVLRRLSQNTSPAPTIKPPPVTTNLSSGDQTASASPAPPASPADVPLSSPVTRQRNNSQLSSLRATPESAAKVPCMPSTDDFEFVKPISRGAFGRVYLTRKKATKDLYAIKVMRKKDIIVKNMITQTLAERRALTMLASEWVVRLYYAFHSSKHLFLVMEYLVGGDLAGLLRVWVVMEAEAAKFYIAEIGCAIDYLHRNSMVHRDIKPDNIMLSSDGHIKLTDFGLSQVAVHGSVDAKPLLDGSELTQAGDFDDTERIPDRVDEYWRALLDQPGSDAQTASPAANSALTAKALPQSKRAHARKSSQRCLGTPDYLAPELQVGASNGFPVDWWALGVCLFEFLCGYPPFTDKSPEAIFRNILNHAIDWPEEEGYVSEAAVELINALLRPDPATRARWKDIKAARLYEGWDLTRIRQMEPPLVPQPDDEVDTSYFESCQRTEIQRLSNATFLQIDAARRPPPPPLPRSASKPDGSALPEPGDESQQSAQPDLQQGSQRGSRRERAASRSAVVVNGGSGVSVSSAGQLKRLFGGVPYDEEYVNVGNEPSSEEYVVLDDVMPSQAAESITTVSSSDKYSFTNDGVGSGAERDEQALNEPQHTYAASISGLEGAGEMDAECEHDSISSLSKPETEPEALPSLLIPAVPRQTTRSEAPLTPRPLFAVTSLPPLPISHAKRVISRSPSQFSNGILDAAAHSGPTSKSHSRCASATIALPTAKKGGSNIKTRRPSHSPEYSSESEHAAPLVRSSSTDERLQCATSGSASAMIPSADGCGSAASSNAGGDNDNDDDDESETRDEDAERAFEDFTYKNIALLSHVNRGVSSSGHATPAIERPPPGMSALSTIPAAAMTAPVAVPNHRPSVYGSAPGTARGSPINAYDVKSQSPGV
ncbi:hypothetical protein IWW47_000279 [Coemansia sp. RSA 2052]|nr:hypothetical protein IWW47_000279 [Coemansia sp. RSA 2052]